MMNLRSLFLIPVLLGVRGVAHADPPYSGTIFIDPDIITKADPTAYVKIIYEGRAVRTVFDRRTNKFSKVKMHIITARYSDSKNLEIQVNPEFGGKDKARVQAAKFAKVFGRLPLCLRQNIDTMTIHGGLQPFGGGSRNVLIHTLQSVEYERDGILEETLVHEATHAALDATHAASKGWLAAQQSDPDFISTYARDNPTREDVAESFLLYLAVRYRAERIAPEVADQINATMPARIAYFDKQKFDVRPID